MIKYFTFCFKYSLPETLLASLLPDLSGRWFPDLSGRWFPDWRRVVGGPVIKLSDSTAGPEWIVLGPGGSATAERDTNAAWLKSIGIFRIESKSCIVVQCMFLKHLRCYINYYILKFVKLKFVWKKHLLPTSKQEGFYLSNICWYFWNSLKTLFVNNNFTGVKYSLIVLGGGLKLSHVSVLTYLLVKSYFCFILNCNFRNFS